MKMTTESKFCLFFLALFPQFAFALGIRVADQDAAATARGNAFVATADNPSAIFYNPAGITQLEGQNFRLGGYGIGIDIDYSSSSGKSIGNKHDFAVLPQFYYTLTPPKSPLSLGFGVYSPFGLGLDYGDDTPFRTLTKKGEIKFLTFSPVTAWKISPTLSVGLGATLNFAEATLSRGVFLPGDDFRFRGAGTSYGFTAGIRWEPSPQHAFGVTYHSATDLDFSGHAALNTKPFTVPTPFGPFPVAAIHTEEDASAKFHFPQYIVAGYSFRPTPDWNFEVNVDWTDWDSLNQVILKQQRSASIAIPFNWKSSLFYEAGVTRRFAHGFHASAGYIYSENSVPERDFTPTVPDSNRHIFSAGIGQNTGRFNWDLAYQFARSPHRVIDNGTAANGIYRFTSHAVTLSAGFTF
jgi:long-chain fatty acid transport protein